MSRIPHLPKKMKKRRRSRGSNTGAIGVLLGLHTCLGDLVGVPHAGLQLGQIEERADDKTRNAPISRRDKVEHCSEDSSKTHDPQLVGEARWSMVLRTHRGIVGRRGWPPGVRHHVRLLGLRRSVDLLALHQHSARLRSPPKPQVSTAISMFTHHPVRGCVPSVCGVGLPALRTHRLRQRGLGGGGDPEGVGVLDGADERSEGCLRSAPRNPRSQLFTCVCLCVCVLCVISHLCVLCVCVRVRAWCAWCVRVCESATAQYVAPGLWYVELGVPDS